MTIAAPDIFASIYAAHGHRCPMSTLGGRLGLAIRARLEDADLAALQASYGSRTCALDGIAEVLGCREENDRLRVAGDGRHRLEVILPGRRLSAELSRRALQLAGGYRQLANRLEAGWDALDAEERTRRTAELAAALDALLPKLWQADERELLSVEEAADA